MSYGQDLIATSSQNAMANNHDKSAIDERRKMVENNRKSNFEFGEIKMKNKYAIDTSSKAAFNETILKNLQKNQSSKSDFKSANFVLGSTTTDYKTTNK